MRKKKNLKISQQKKDKKDNTHQKQCELQDNRATFFKYSKKTGNLKFYTQQKSLLVTKG